MLTPQEIAEGWILLFDGETTFGWKIDGDAKVTDGLLTVGGDKETIVTLTTEFGDLEVRLAYRSLGEKPVELWLAKSTSKSVTKLGRSGADIKGWDEGIIKWEGNSVTKEFRTAAGGKARSQGTFGGVLGRSTFGFSIPAGTKLVLREAKVKSLGLQPIFNGKDLTGWREFPGRKSKFTVTDKGELNIKDGPGDLQTEAAWANFVLQFDCKSHGKHLNSGLFFRCRPGEYQNGYEAQIRNQFTPEPTQEYTIEDYDPETNKLVGKRKIKSAAFDYGTGAIYRRMPARKEMSKDNEWFTMTVIADGRHFATWVNGIQVVDWTDNRPLSDNARTGCRLEAGPISLQGHDPTTHLSFRNFRIAEISK